MKDSGSGLAARPEPPLPPKDLDERLSQPKGDLDLGPDTDLVDARVASTRVSWLVTEHAVG